MFYRKMKMMLKSKSVIFGMMMPIYFQSLGFGIMYGINSDIDANTSEEYREYTKASFDIFLMSILCGTFAYRYISINVLN